MFVVIPGIVGPGLKTTIEFTYIWDWSIVNFFTIWARIYLKMVFLDMFIFFNLVISTVYKRIAKTKLIA